MTRMNFFREYGDWGGGCEFVAHFSIECSLMSDKNMFTSVWWIMDSFFFFFLYCTFQIKRNLIGACIRKGGAVGL